MPPGQGNEYLMMEHMAVQGGYNPSMYQIPPQFGMPYPPQQYPPQQYPQQPPMQQYPPQNYAQQYMQQPQASPQQAYRPEQENGKPTIVVSMTQREKDLLMAYTQFNKISVDEFVTKTVMEKLNEEFEKKSVYIAYDAFKDNPETFTLEEVLENYDL